tara:strand:- start:1188 stop:1385 length:198 start_codon:yes stop_codon:yes gene_type:complete
MKLYNNFQKEVQKFPIIAGMRLDGRGNNKLKIVGYRWVEFTYDVNPEVADDKFIVGEKIIKKTFL